MPFRLASLGLRTADTEDSLTIESRWGSDPAANPAQIILERGAELAAHFLFL
jgi:hypothetical protein